MRYGSRFGGPGQIGRRCRQGVVPRPGYCQGVCDRTRGHQCGLHCGGRGRQADRSDLAAKLQDAQLKTIKWPADGKYLGDWKAGEKLAQSGRGLTWTDAADTANGGNCYNCHQLDPKEISFGTIGPSLTGYGKTRGVIADPTSPASKAIIEYTWGKIWNAKAYNACSVMPRAVHKGIITEAQAKDLMALLLDPKSPVNN